jgi:hypothetical protein
MSKTVLAVAGLNDMRKGFRAMDAGMGKTVRLTLNDVAQVVVDAAKPGIPRRTGAAAASVKAASSQTQAKVSAGGNKAPYYPWLDFGGSVGKRKSVHRDFLKAGRYIYPAVADNQDAIQAAMFKAVSKLAHESGIEVS